MIHLILLAFVCCFFLALWHHYSYWKRHNVPFVPVKFPYISLKFPFFFGNMTSEKHAALQLSDMYKQFPDSPIIGFHMFFRPSVLIRDLNLIKCVQSTNFNHFQDRGMFYNEKDDPLSAILGTLNHDKWKPLRYKLTPAFSPTKIKQMFGKIKIVGDVLIKGLNEDIEIDDEVEIRDLFSRFTTDVIGRVTIGIECNTLNSCTELREMARKAMQPYLKFPWNYFTIAYPNFSRWWGARKHPKEVSDFFVNVIDQTIQYRKENKETRDDYMQLLIDADLTTNEIAALAFDLLSAGYSDSTSTLAYCLYELSLPKNNQIQDKAREEIRTVLEQHNGQLTYDVLHKMVYCDQIINETLRKHPVAGNATRICNEAYQVANTDFTIPKGMRVFIPIYAIHHDEKLYPNPEKFDPERFSEKPSTGSFLSFGGGPRTCIGFRFANLLIGVGLVSLLQHFVFTICDRTQIPIKYSTTKNTLIPENGVWLKVSRIQRSD